MPSQTPTRLLKLAAVRDLTTLSRSEIYRRISEGRFPAPVRLGGAKRVAWVEAAVTDWIDSQVAAAKAAGRAGGCQ